MNNLDWSLIDWQLFEELALDYAKSTYPRFDWMKSPGRGHNQDNHDIKAFALGEEIRTAGFSIEETNLQSQYEIWGEVKHSKKPKKSIGKQQLDPTIVSAMIAGNVIFLLLITNKKFTSNYKIRAEKVLSQTTKYFDYVDIDDIEDWLRANKPFYKKYFGIPLEESDYSETRVILKEACIFDLKDLKNKFYTVVKNLKVNQSYVLFISIKSNIAGDLNILNPLSFPFIIEQLPGFDYHGGFLHLRKGTNNFFLLINTIRIAPMKWLELNLADSESNLYQIKCKLNCFIRDYRDIQITFSQQTVLIDKLIKIFIEESQEQLAFLLYAKGGTGKSTVLDKLYLEIGQRKQVLSIDFSDNPNINAKKIGELILFLCYGDYYLNINSEILDRLKKSNPYVNPIIIDQIIALVSQTDGADVYLSQIINENQSNELIPFKNQVETKIILCDDVHKLDSSSVLAIKKVLSHLIKNNFRVYFIMAAREHEFVNQDLATFLKNSNIGHFNLDNPTSQDIYQTLTNYFGNLAGFLTINTLDDYKLNTIIWKEVLKDLDKEVKLYPKDRSGISTYFNIQIREVSQRRETFLRKIFVPFEKMNYLLNVIYAYKHGLEINKTLLAFQALGFSVAILKNDLDILIDENVVRKEGDSLYPWHDIYVQEYQLYKGDKFYTESLADFLELYLNSDTENTSLTISLILKCNTHKKDLYLNKAKQLRDMYFDLTNFGAALDLSGAIVHYYKNGVNRKTYSYEELAADFMYAVCLNHCDSLIPVKRILNEVYEIGIAITGDVRCKTIAYEAKAELFNLKYWSLDTNEVLQDLTNFISLLDKNYNEYQWLMHFSNAYLISLNRLMVFNLLLDNYEEAKSLLAKCIDASRQLNRLEYVGFAMMDYAKGIYHIAIEEALSHLRAAKVIFIETKQQRRLLDCECEICFLEEIIFGSNLINLENACLKLLENGLSNLYVKSLLKLAACLLVSGRADKEEIVQLIDKALKVNKQIANMRIDLICSNIYYAVKRKFHFNEDNDADLRKHKLSCKSIGDSYLLIAKHNENVVNANSTSWATSGKNFESNSVLVDPRIW